MRIRILHTNDVHSRYENFAKVTTKIREMKNENTLVLDAGDFHDFMRMELKGTDGEAGAKLLSIAGCEAIAMGNNELFSGLDILQNMAEKSAVPFLSCNLYKLDGTGIPNIKRSMIIEKGGIRFLIIGTSPEVNQFLVLNNLKATKADAEIRKELTANKGKYDISILLSHSGIKEDREYAAEIDGIDLIIDGHSHVLMNEPEVINGTIIHQSGMFSENLGVLDLDIAGSKITSFNGININIMKEPEDNEIMNEIAVQAERAEDKLGQPLYSINKDLWHDVIEENPITNLLADILYDLFDCDLAVINSGILNAGIKAGPVSKKKLLDICPSPLNPTYMEIMGKYIREALERSLKASTCLQEGHGPGFRGRFLGRLHVSGALIKHDGKHIISVLVNGKELDDEKVYKVATSDYLQRGSGYTSLKNNVNEYYREEYIRDDLEKYLCREEFLDKAFKERWNLIN